MIVYSILNKIYRRGRRAKYVVIAWAIFSKRPEIFVVCNNYLLFQTVDNLKSQSGLHVRQRFEIDVVNHAHSHMYTNSNVQNHAYYIPTEIYSPKSYVVNFFTQMSFNQSEERTIFCTRKKNDTSNQKPQRCVSFVPKFPPFLGACSLQRPRLTSCQADIQRADSFSRRVFS